MEKNASRLDINSGYLDELLDYSEGHWIEKLENDISSLTVNAKIYWDREHFSQRHFPFYKEVRSFMVRAVLKNWEKNYYVFAPEYEVNKFRAIAGNNNVIGDHKTGVRFIGKRQYAPDYSSVLGLKRHKE